MQHTDMMSERMHKDSLTNSLHSNLTHCAILTSNLHLLISEPKFWSDLLIEDKLLSRSDKMYV